MANNIFLILMFIMSACHTAKVHKAPQTYRVDFRGFNSAFVDPRTGEPPVDEYAVGEIVLLRFRMQAYDERYIFYLDDEELTPSYYNEEYGYCLSFIMPDHDVVVRWKSINIMGKYEETRELKGAEVKE